MKKIIEWFKQSNRYKHFIGGFILGFISINIIDGFINSLIAGLCLEYKDKAYGNEFDWLDISCTVIGGIIAVAIRTIIYVCCN